MAMNQIENRIEQMIIEYGKNIWQQLIKNIIGAIETDITTQVDISLADMNDILHSERTRKHISDNIMRAMINELNKIKNIEITT